MNLTRRTTLALMLSSVAAPAFAAQPPVFSNDGAAINGYDPVAYFTDEMPVKGSADHTSTHNGATFQFKDAANKASFDADPDKYAPQYGGYCAYAVSKGYTAKTDPDAWHVENGKLYLNYNKAVRLIWRRDVPGNIVLGDKNWPKVLEN